jgi:PTH1 family peptidyl-tRNA hydrolase
VASIGILIKKTLRARPSDSGGARESAAWLVVGLGNPGAEYKKNRHNIGFMAADRIAEEHRFPSFRKKFQGELAEGNVAGQKVILLKPQTYMNLSGQSVAAAAKFYKIRPDRIAVFHDELDLPPGKVRVKCGGGNAGHNGLKSMQAHLGTADFWRVRLGIGHPGDKARVHGHVLGDFAKADQEWLDKLLTACSDNLKILVEGDMDAYMSKVAQETGE